MAKMKVTKEFEVCKEIGKDLLNDFLEDYYGNYVDEDSTILYKDLDTENAIIFLQELKNQFIDEIDGEINNLKETAATN